jgi:G3E family GTPase
LPSTHSNRIPVLIVSGFLGAGKTTFIQKLVSPSLDRERIVILENEFGDVDFDGPQLRKQGVSVVSVLAGCICCTGVGNFTGSIQEVAEDFSPRLIVIEPTGVAKLSDILVQFRLPPLVGLCAVKQSITVVDAKNFLKRYSISEEFFEDQLESTDIVILSKTEGLGKDVIDAVTHQIHEIAPNCLIIDRPWESLSEDERETCQGYRMTQGKGHEHHHGHEHHGEHEHHEHHEHEHHEHDHHEHDHHEHDHHDHEHSHAFVAYTFTPSCSAEFFKENASELSGWRFGNVLRVKGFLKSTTGAWMQVDYVPGELLITEVQSETQAVPQLVFIGAGLKEQAIAEFMQ